MRLDDGHDALHEREGLRLKPYLDTKEYQRFTVGTFYLDGKKVTMQDKPLTILKRIS
jgi:hypothetical protein